VSTILVADDNSNIQKMVGIALKDHGIEVIAVGNGEAAVRKLAESVPDLILADIFMPVRNGYEVCEYVKKDDRFAHVPVVLLVGAFDPLDEREVERVRADGVLKKPFVPPDPLIELVKSLLGRTAGAAAEAAASAGAAAEDVESTQDISAGIPGHSPTGTMRMPPPTERTQRLEPEPQARMSSGTVEVPMPEFLPPRPAAEAPQRSGTVEVPRPEIPPTERTQKLEPESSSAAPEGVENFKLGLEEPAPPPTMEKTQQLSATDISKILSRETPLNVPPPAEVEEEDFAVPPSAVDFHGKESPLAFEDMLGPTDEEEAAVEEPGSGLGVGGYEGEEEEEAEEEEADEAEVRFGGIREEAKSPDPDLPPIPVDFGHSEPMEIITEEHAEHSTHDIGPAENLVSSTSGWAAGSGTGPAVESEPGLVSEGSEGFMTPHPAPMRGIAHEEPAEEFPVPAAGIAATPDNAFEETAELPKHILQEEVDRAQDIAARVAAQNREFLAQEEASGAAAGTPLTGPSIDHAINAADTILARHRTQSGAGEVPAVSAAPAAASGHPAAPPPAAAEAPSGAPKTSGPAGAEMIEAISERVLANLDPYLIEKISKEIVRPIVEAMIRKELEKFE